MELQRRNQQREEMEHHVAGMSQQKKIRDFHKLSKSQCFDKLNGRDSVCHHLWMYQMYLTFYI